MSIYKTIRNEDGKTVGNVLVPNWTGVDSLVDVSPVLSLCSCKAGSCKKCKCAINGWPAVILKVSSNFIEQYCYAYNPNRFIR